MSKFDTLFKQIINEEEASDLPPKGGVVLWAVFNKGSSGFRNPLDKKQDYLNKLRFCIEKGKKFGEGNPLRHIPKGTKIQPLGNSLEKPDWGMTVRVMIDNTPEAIAELKDLARTCGAEKTSTDEYSSIKWAND